MENIELKAYAKINLAIDLLGKRPDNYNEVKMIMQTINIFDKIYIEKVEKGIVLESDTPNIPNDDRNIAYKAANYVLNQYDIDSGVKIKIEKNIPISAGLAGGSTDAAAVIKGMNKLFGLNLDNNTLLKLGEKMGADVPYCMLKNTALATGIGEKITKLPNIGSIDVVLIKPRVGVSTASVYKNFDYSLPKKRPDFDILINAITNRDINTLAHNMVNVLETVTQTKNPVIKDIKEQLVSNGAIGAMMSGSGPTVFALFKDNHSAKNAYEVMKNKNSYYCYLTKTICFSDC